MLFSIFLVGCSDSVLKELNKDLKNNGLKECRVSDEELSKYNWKIGSGILCKDISNCDENKYVQLKGYKVDCLPTKYVTDGTKCKDGEKFERNLPDDAAICRNGKLYMLEGVYNQYKVFAEEMAKLMLSKENIKNLGENAKDIASKKAEQGVNKIIGKKSCSFGSTTCDYTSISDQSFKIKLKNDFVYPIRIRKEPFKVTICSNATLNNVNGKIEFPFLVNSKEEFEIEASCSSDFDQSKKMQIEFVYNNTETGLGYQNYIFIE